MFHSYVTVYQRVATPKIDRKVGSLWKYPESCGIH